MIKYPVVFFLSLLLFVPRYALCEGFSQEDKERLIRLETKVEEGQKALQRQIDGLSNTTQRQLDALTATTHRQIEGLSVGLQRQIDDLRTLLLWGFGILFGGMGLLIGFVIWDRRTALEPVIRKYRDIEDKEEKFLKVLKEYSNVEPKLAEILRSFNLL